MVCGIDRWDVPGDARVHEPRLEHPDCGLKDSLSPQPTTRDGTYQLSGSLGCTIAPNAADWPIIQCSASSMQTSAMVAASLVPSRFIVCCPRGHIDDFPYFEWVHSGTGGAGGTHDLYIETKGASASLRDIIIRVRAKNLAAWMAHLESVPSPE